MSTLIIKKNPDHKEDRGVEITEPADLNYSTANSSVTSGELNLSGANCAPSHDEQSLSPLNRSAAQPEPHPPGSDRRTSSRLAAIHRDVEKRGEPQPTTRRRQAGEKYVNRPINNKQNFPKMRVKKPVI
jgi:hypothetical protein